ncbi:MAG TPA: OmpA family protein [bacterium]|nr:OmpA family protein [bacterium]
MFKRTRGVGLAVVLLAGLITHPRSAGALNVQLLRPGTGHVQGFHLFTSETLPKHRLAAGLNLNLANHPFEQVPVGTTIRTTGLVDRFVTADLLLSYGALDWLTLNLGMPVNVYHDIAPTPTSGRDRGGGDAGDLILNAKIRIFDAEKTGSHLGLAVVPFVTLPTGRQSIFFGDSSVTGGAVVAGDAQWKSNRFYLNVGARFRETETIANLTVKHEFVFGGGFQRPIVKKWDLNVIAEVFGSTTLSKNFVVQDISTPLEGMVVLQKKWLENRNLITHVGAGAGLTNGYGAPNVRAILGVSYAWDFKKDDRPAPVAVREEVIATSKIHFAYNRSEILPSSHAVLDDIVRTIKGRPEIRQVRVEGHTDSHGADEYNQRLSEKRAQAVMQYLTNNGIPADRVTAVGMGETKPVADNVTKSGRAQNRRVEFHLQVAEGAKVRIRESQEAAPTYEQGDPGETRRRR